MNFKISKLWEIKILSWKLYAGMIYDNFLVFVCRCPPFSCFFYTLRYFKIDEIYKNNFEMQKKKTPHPNKDIKKEVLEKSIREYKEDLITRLTEAKNEADVATERSNKVKAKLAQFTQLLRNVSTAERQEYSEKVNELFDSNDLDGSLEKIISYIDSIIEKHAE
ncbi:MAG: hypothetical protein WC678_02895 [Parcubacteria group bacterium]|jgi:hypothetical protein